MRKVEFSRWGDNVEQNANEICMVVSQVQKIHEKLKIYTLLSDELNFVYSNICEVLEFWTGRTYVGFKKNPLIQDAFQAFFDVLYGFLLECKKSEYKELQAFANSVLYNGVLYRYLGHGSCNKNIDTPIEPIFNPIYVSWSKNSKNPYIETKLYGKKTVLTCEVSKPYYGIDLEEFGVVKGNEAEVVFPTIMETIKDIKYL